jgi:hypothetical protein
VVFFVLHRGRGVLIPGVLKEWIASSWTPENYGGMCLRNVGKSVTLAIHRNNPQDLNPQHHAVKNLKIFAFRASLFWMF